VVQAWECDSCDKRCRRYTDNDGDFPVIDGRLCKEAEYPNTNAHFVPIDFHEITEEQYIEALNIYLDIAYPDDKRIWRIIVGQRMESGEISGEHQRRSIFVSVCEEPHRSAFFRHGIPSSITFGSWIQPHMKLRYDDCGYKDKKELWVESNERSEDGEVACELSREIAQEIEKAWREQLDWFEEGD